MTELCAVTSYFNPSGYCTKLENYRRFLEGMAASQVPVFTIECAFEDRPFSLPPDPRVLQVRARDVLWHKERLLNVLICKLPPAFTKVAWLDCDLLFENPDWARLTSSALDEVAVLQPYDTVVRMPRDRRQTGKVQQWESFSAVYRDTPHLHRSGRFNQHGHTGFAWAARRDLLQLHGLYDACMTGSGDHLMAHGFCGDCTSPCIAGMIGQNTPQARHFAAWATRIGADVRRRVSFIPGRLLHLWHGELADRRYWEHNLALCQLAFDPTADIQIDPGGCWQWTRPELRRWALEFFASRKEDGDEAVPHSAAVFR